MEWLIISDGQYIERDKDGTMSRMNKDRAGQGVKWGWGWGHLGAG